VGKGSLRVPPHGYNFPSVLPFALTTMKVLADNFFSPPTHHPEAVLPLSSRVSVAISWAVFLPFPFRLALW